MEEYWLLYFEDADRADELFTDEVCARHRHIQCQQNWACHLFRQAGPIGESVTQGKSVKPLVWESTDLAEWVPVRDRVVARSAVGEYRVEFNLRGRAFMFTTPDISKRVPFNNPIACDSIEHGKELCEADYRARIAALFE